LNNPNRCPKIQSGSGLAYYVPIWLSDYSMHFEGDQILYIKCSGEVAAQEGQATVLQGGMIAKIWAPERYRQLYYQLPGNCYGPYWIVDE